MKDSWHKVLLLVVSVVVVAVSALTIVNATGFTEKFQLTKNVENNELPEIDDEVVALAKDFVVSERKWNVPELGAAGAKKPVRLFVSIPLVEASGELVDMLDPNAKQLRPPVTNAWLLNNELDFLNASVLEQDTDGDGFTNLEEWTAKSDPRDVASHPPYVDKLVMIDRQQQEYKLRLATRLDTERFQIQRLPTARWPQQENFIMRIGETSKDEQFRLDSVEERKVTNNFGIEETVPVLSLTYLPKNEKHELVLRNELLIPTYFVKLDFLLNPGELDYIKEGDAFNLVKDVGTKYRVMTINENSTVIAYQKDQEEEKTAEIQKK